MATTTKTKTKAKPEAVSPASDASQDEPASSNSANDADADATTHKKKRKASAAANLPELEVDLSLPEPPSKRAKRALKKGKPLRPKPQSDDEADKDAKDNAADAKKERSQFGIWIGNLSFTITRPQLFQWFVDSSGGAITEEAITRVNLPTKKPAKGSSSSSSSSHATDGKDLPPPNKGFAYVDFATYEAQVAAVALSETELAGRPVLIKDSKSFVGRPTKEAESAGATGAATGVPAPGTAAATAATAAAAGSGSTKIFVGNLGFEVTEDDLRRHFAPCGPIAWAKVATFPDNTEKCRGYGWVQFGRGPAGQTATDDGDDHEDEIKNVDIKPGSTPAEVAAIAAAAAVRGSVKIREVVETEDDFVAEVKADDAAAEADSAARTRTRKWWVNMLKGRPLKIQFAEDDKVRYNKRFRGKQGGKQQDKQDGKQDGKRTQERPQQEKRKDPGEADVDRPYKMQDLSIAQRTGAVTASLGKKIVFD